jgi:carbamoylphosphate synthase small subunit
MSLQVCVELHSVEDHGVVDSEPKKTKKDKRKNVRERNPLKKGDDFSLERASSEHVHTSTPNSVDEGAEHIEEKPTDLRFAVDCGVRYLLLVCFYQNTFKVSLFLYDTTLQCKG